jgi:hypothetical protein
MAEYELTFELDEITEAQKDRIYDAYDAVVAVHGRTTLVTRTASGATGVAAATSAVAELEALGVVVRRLYEDLVSRAQIAERAGVTPQAVGLWAEVNTWLVTQGKGDGFQHPGRHDYLQTNSWLISRRGPRPAGYSGSRVG